MLIIMIVRARLLALKQGFNNNNNNGYLERLPAQALSACMFLNAHTFKIQRIQLNTNARTHTLARREREREREREKRESCISEQVHHQD